MQNNVTTLTRNQLIASAAGTLEVLEILGNADAAVTLGAVVAACGRPKATVHRMLATLVNTGFVAHEPASGHYRLTLKMWRLGASAVRDLDLTRIALSSLERLMLETSETVHLTVLDPSGDVIYVSKVESPQSIRVQTRLGELNPSWCTATGRCLLAFNKKVADLVLARKLPARTPKTVTDPAKIRRILADVGARGYAVTCAENHPEMGGVAAPIHDHTGAVGAACGVAIPAFRMDASLVDRVIPRVVRAARDISRALGYVEAKAVEAHAE